MTGRAMRTTVALLAATILVLSVPAGRAAAQGGSAHADNSGIAIIGNLDNSVVIGSLKDLSPEQIAALIAALKKPNVDALNKIDALSRELGVTNDAVASFFRILGDERVPPEQYRVTLENIATRYIDLRDRLSTLDTGSPANRQRLEEARTAIERADYDRAETLLAAVEEAEATARKQAQDTVDVIAHRQAAARAERGRLSQLRLDDLGAAEHYRTAANLLPATDAESRTRYLWESAAALHRYGVEKGDNSSLFQSADRYRAAIALVPRNLDWITWAGLHNNLGTVLQTLGQRENSTARLEEAVTAYENALIEFTRERAPLQWAKVQSNLDTVLRMLGTQDSGTKRLEEVVTTVKSALLKQSRELAPLRWAETQDNLGTVLRKLGSQESGTDRLEEAVIAYENALLERTRERVPLEWAETQNNLGIALRMLGVREDNAERLEEAVAAFRNALLERTRERFPLQWAETQDNLGGALHVLGWLNGRSKRLEEAVVALRSALLERTRERFPLQWAETQENLGMALLLIAVHKNDGAKAAEAVAVLEMALAVLTKARGSHDVEKSVNALALAREILARLETTAP